MKKVLQLHRNGLNWPGADVTLEDDEADRRIKAGEALEYNDENRAKVQKLVAGTTHGGVSAEKVSLDDLAELERKGFKLAEAGATQVVPIEHDPKFNEVAAKVNPPSGNKGAEPGAPSTVTTLKARAALAEAAQENRPVNPLNPDESKPDAKTPKK